MIADWKPRQRVWIALSDLFLDTDVSLHFDYITRELVPAPFTLDELDMILRDEVAPVFLPNLLVVAGEWAGFPEERVAQKIGAYLRRPGWWRRLGRPRRAVLLRQFVPEWPALLQRIATEREGLGQ